MRLFAKVHFLIVTFMSPPMSSDIPISVCSRNLFAWFELSPFFKLSPVFPFVPLLVLKNMAIEPIGFH